jgi:hypothetical protein
MYNCKILENDTNLVSGMPLPFVCRRKFSDHLQLNFYSFKVPKVEEI